MTPVRVVPALEPLEDGHARLGVALKPAPGQHLALQRGEEALSHGIVVRITSGLVFTTVRRGAGGRLGTGLHPRNVLRLLHRLLDKAGLPHVRFHDLRHSAASLLIAAGVELVEVSMLLGHSEMRVTADLYSHLQQQTASRAAQHMDAVLVREGVSGPDPIS